MYSWPIGQSNCNDVIKGEAADKLVTVCEDLDTYTSIFHIIVRIWHKR